MTGAADFSTTSFEIEMEVAPSENVLLPSEVDSEQESPYLRRQRAVTVRRERFSRRWRVLAFVVFVLIPVGLMGYLAATFALTSPIFLLTSQADVLVSGNRVVSREDVLSALGIPSSSRPGQKTNIFRMSLAQKKKQVESIPWVKSAALSRSFPHRLGVYLTERTPVALVNVDGYLKLVDGDGVILDKPEEGRLDFPLLTGLESAASAEERKVRLDLFQDFTRTLSDEIARSGWQVSEVDLSDAEDLKALLVQGDNTIRVDFGNREFLERFHNFLSLLPEIQKASTKIDSVDLRFRRQVVVNPAAGDQQAPSGGRAS